MKLIDSFVPLLSEILRKGRHAKIHMVMATQEVGKQDMVINLNNIQARMAFTTSNFYNSRSILGEGGAEKLPGNGAMIFKSMEQSKLINLQGAFISPEKIEEVLEYITSQDHKFDNKFMIPEMNQSEPLILADGIIGEIQPKCDPDKKELADIIMWVLGQDEISAEKVKGKFTMGNRANEIMDKLFSLGIITEKLAKQPRKVRIFEYDNLTKEILELLEYGNYTTEQIQKVFTIRKIGKI
jgi:S-DNA-T family DNA segregation ATPase FtsK/SpoIIIE